MHPTISWRVLQGDNISLSKPNHLKTLFRMNLVSLAKQMLNNRDSITTEAEFNKFAEELFEELNDFAKFDAFKLQEQIEKEVVTELVAEMADAMLEENLFEMAYHQGTMFQSDDEQSDYSEPEDWREAVEQSMRCERAVFVEAQVSGEAEALGEVQVLENLAWEAEVAEGNLAWEAQVAEENIARHQEWQARYLEEQEGGLEVFLSQQAREKEAGEEMNTGEEMETGEGMKDDEEMETGEKGMTREEKEVVTQVNLLVLHIVSPGTPGEDLLACLSRLLTLEVKTTQLYRCTVVSLYSCIAVQLYRCTFL